MLSTGLHFASESTLYDHVHRIHHTNVDVGPITGLSMHPVEHLLYWSDSLIHLILPSHPLLFLYGLHITGTGALSQPLMLARVAPGPYHWPSQPNWAVSMARA